MQVEQQYKLYPARYLIVFLYALAQFTISILLNTITPIAQYICQIYQLDSVSTNFAGLAFILMHPIFIFPASYVIDTYGTRIGILIGSLLAILGVSLRMLVNHSFVWVIVGQVIAGIGRPFILNCQAKISANWFSSSSRGGITQLLTLVLNVSLIIGFFIPTFVFSGYKPVKDDQASIQQGKNVTFRLMLTQTIIALCCLLPNIIFQKSTPPTPASASGSIKRQQFSLAIPKVMKNKNFLLLLFVFFLYFGIFNAISTNLSYLLKPFFGKDSLPFVVSVVGGSPVISGIIGVIILGQMQRKSGKYKKWIIICMIGSLVAMLLFYPIILSQSLIPVSLISAFNSFFLIPLVPIILELGCEIVFPVGEGLAVGLLFAFGNLGGFVLGFFLSLIMEQISKQRTLGGLLFCVGAQILGLILLLFLKQQKNRQKAQSQSTSQRTKSAVIQEPGKPVRISLMEKNTVSTSQRQSFTQGYVKLQDSKQQDNYLV